MNNDRQTNNPSERTLPDIAICQATKLTDDFAECLVDKPMICRYAMPFGYTHLCGHPDHPLITANTKKGLEEN